MLRTHLTLLAIAAFGLSGLQSLRADEPAAQAEATGKTVEIFESATLTTPADWKVVEPKVSIIEHEFAATAEDQEGVARVTMMAASGSVEANVERWKGQFQSGKEPAKQETKTIAGHTVYLVDLKGSFNERMGGPFAGGRVVERKDYAMAGAIIVDPKERKYFIKMIGPAAIVKANREAFGEMVESLQGK